MAGEKDRQPGQFTIEEGRSIFGELTISDPKTTLRLRDQEFIATHAIPDQCITGVLHDLTKVSLIGCVTPGAPGRVASPGGEYYFAKVFAHFVISGDHFLRPNDEVITGLVIYLDDAKVLFNDPDAFGAVFIDAQPLVEEAMRREVHRISRETGPGARVIYYTGKNEIAGFESVLGRVLVEHRPGFQFGGDEGGILDDEVAVSVSFGSPVSLHKSLESVWQLTSFFGMLVGRPQNLNAFYAITSSGENGGPLKIDWTMYRGRGLNAESERPSSFDVLIDAVRHHDEFAKVAEAWLGRHEQWHAARWRFFNSFAEQRHYDIDRLVASANMFDILPASAVPADVPLSSELESARDACRDRFRKLPISPERDSVLGCLGRLGKSSLKQKVRHRAKIVIEGGGEALMQLLRVTDEAVNCRNFYVHGSEGSFDYDRNFDAVIFFVDTLEFVFAVSDLIEAGWNFRRWLAAGTAMSHPFARYRVGYLNSFQKLSTLLATRT